MTLQLDKLCREGAFEKAWRRISAKASGGGLDGVTVAAFAERLSGNINDLRREVLTGQYRPQPLQQVARPKEGKPGETRTLRMPAVRDKIVQEVVRAGLQPILERVFLNCSYGYRPGRGAQRAVRRVTHELVSGRKPWAASADIDDFFGSLDQNLLIERLRPHVSDEAVLRLIRLWLRMGAVDWRGRWHDIRIGVGLGGVLSPLLANFYLHNFDEHLTAGGQTLVRYADDFVLLAATRDAVQDSLAVATGYLKKVLGLRLNNRPHAIRGPEEGFNFLGIHFRSGSRWLDADRAARIESRLEHLCERSVPGQPEHALAAFNTAVSGWRNYYGVLLGPEALDALDVTIGRGLKQLLKTCFRRRALGSNGAAESALEHVELIKVRTGEERSDYLNQLIRAARSEATTPELHVPAATNHGGSQSGSGTRQARSVDSTVRSAKRRHLIHRTVTSDLVIATPGHFVGKSGDRVVVRYQRRIVVEIPAARLCSVTLATHGVSLSADVIALCAERGVPLLFIDARSHVGAVLSAPAAGRPATCVAQLSTHSNPAGALDLARRFARGKIRNQFATMKALNKYRGRRDQEFGVVFERYRTETEKLLRELNGLRFGGPLQQERNRIFAVEGRGAQWYWEVFGVAIRGRTTFPGRTGKGARDPVNMLLNYGYAILESRVHAAIVKAGLVPELGMLHAAQDGRWALVYDLMEEFRPAIVDRCVLAMLGRRQLPRLGNDGLLSAPTRARLVKVVRARLGTLSRFRSGEHTLDEIILLQARLLAAHMLRTATYRPFAARW